jgi:hypothetical protein
MEPHDSNLFRLKGLGPAPVGTQCPCSIQPYHPEESSAPIFLNGGRGGVSISEVVEVEFTSTHHAFLAPVCHRFDPKWVHLWPVLNCENRCFPGLFALEGSQSANFFLVRLLLLGLPGDFEDFGKTTLQ